MVFSELRFFVFLAVVLTVYWSLRTNGLRKLWLLAASYLFYSFWDWRFTLLLICSTLMNFWFGIVISRAIDPMARKRLLQINLILNLVVLGFFKYYNFFAESLVLAMHQLGVHLPRPTLDIILPVGISFYTFQAISYTVDVYRRELKPTNNVVDFALFISFFPHCVAGPIVRAVDFLPQLNQSKQWANLPLRYSLALFLVGFFKKACVSDNLSPYVDVCFNNAADFSSSSIRLAVILYAIQIYCDFSGYSDMAVGGAGLFGYRLCMNFDAPYLSTSIAEFWRRWHMSLSSWLRDYLYIPLGGSRRGALRTSINLMLTMLLGGLWHGASWNFVIWGSLHGLALVFSQTIGRRLFGKQVSFFQRLIGWGFTLWWVCLAWILFRATDLSTVRIMAWSWTFGVSTGMSDLPSVLWIHVCVLGLVHTIWRYLEPLEHLYLVSSPVFAAALGVLLSCALSVANNSYRPFIYFQF